MIEDLVKVTFQGNPFCRKLLQTEETNQFCKESQLVHELTHNSLQMN